MQAASLDPHQCSRMELPLGTNEQDLRQLCTAAGLVVSWSTDQVAWNLVSASCSKQSFFVEKGAPMGRISLQWLLTEAHSLTAEGRPSSGNVPP